MRWTRGTALLLTALALAGCTGAPFVDARREAGKQIMVGPSNEEVVAICHAGFDPPPAALKLAESECAKTGRVPRYEQGIRVTCTLSTPTRSYFRCLTPSG